MENTISPNRHQQIAVNKVCKHFKKKRIKRTNLIMCCGSGKSLTALWVLKAMRKVAKTKHTVITVPNLILQKQMFDTFFEEFGNTHKFICVGSNKEVVSAQLDDLIDVTTKKSKIEGFMLQNEDKKTITIATYQSLPNLSDVYNKLEHTVDFAIIDEAHKTIGNQDKLFSDILYDDKIKIDRRLFMTATKRIYIGRRDDIVGMDDVDYYGKTIYDYPMRKAIDDGVLCDYRVGIPFSTHKDVQNFLENNPYIDYQNIDLSEIEKQNLIVGLLAVLSAISVKKCKKIISYHSTIKKATIFRQLLDAVIENKALSIGTFHVNGLQKGKVKFNNITDFENAAIGVLTNSKALVEGVNIPSVDCVLFVDKLTSPIGIEQAIGRAVRKFGGKEMSHVIIPLLENFKGEEENSAAYKKLHDTLISLSLMDKSILHEIKALSNGGTIKNKKIDIESSINVDKGFKTKIDSLITKVNLNIIQKIYRSKPESKEEHISFAVANKLISRRKWQKFDKPVHFYFHPQKVFENFFDEVKARLGIEVNLVKKSRKEHIQFAIDNQLFTPYRWKKMKKENHFYFNPHRVFDDGFFKEVKDKLNIV